MDKLYEFFEFFIPFAWMVGGLILIIKGCEIIAELDGVGRYFMAIAVFFMAVGIAGKIMKDMGLDDSPENKSRKSKRK